MYQAANKQPLFEVLAMIAAYIPLVFFWLSASRDGNSTRLATLICLPISRTNMALTRYAAPVVIQLLLMGIIALSFASFFYVEDWINLRGTEIEYLIGKTSFSFLINFLPSTPSIIALGLVYIAIPLAIDDVFPNVRAKSYGIVAILALSFLLAQSVSIARGHFAIYRIEYLIPIALAVVVFEVFLFNKRRVIT